MSARKLRYEVYSRASSAKGKGDLLATSADVQVAATIAGAYATTIAGVCAAAPLVALYGLEVYVFDTQTGAKL